VFVGLGDFPFPVGKPWKLDGFGPILGDWGSGFRLATRYFEEYGRHYDRFAKPELIPLFRDLLEMRPDIEGVDGVVKWFAKLRQEHTEDWYVPFADLAAMVTNAGERDKPDLFAVGLVRQSARELAKTIQVGLTRAERTLRNRKNSKMTVDSLPIVCVGEMFLHSKVYCEEVRKAVAETYPNNKVFVAKFTPVVGAALMAFADDRILPSREDIVRIARSVLAHPPAVERRIVMPQAPMPSILDSGQE
jgi:N-acetylglucosamine kinase-like BadF-type ATPase